MDISVIVPLYNEAESLPELAAWIERVMKENGYTYEIIFINEMESVTVIDTASIERVEQSNIGVFATVSVFDKTGKSISIIVSSEELNALLMMIRK